jgi:TPR repeat protein
MEHDTSRTYDELAEKLAMGRIDVDEAAIPLVLEEARKRRDGNVIAHVASWYEDVKDDKSLYLELAKEAAELGSPEANFWLGHEYLSGENLPRDYEKAYSCFIKGNDVDWVPIDPEDNTEYDIGGEVEVTAEGLLLDSYGDIGWWLFVLEKHPSRALKCGLADWYMKQGGDENRKRALKLLEESAKEGFDSARQKLSAV